MKRVLFTLFCMAFLTVGVFAGNLYFFLKTPFGDSAQSFQIEKKKSLNQVIQTLHEKKVIANVPLFKAYLFIKQANSKIRAGDYDFTPQMTPPQVLDLLMKGDFKTYRITIPEGWNFKQIAAYLGELKLVDPLKFLAKCSDPSFAQDLGVLSGSLEGYLFPDTYLIYKPKNEEELIQKFVDRFKEVYKKEIVPLMHGGGMTAQDIVILASLIEKETANPAEKPIIASVFFNRLKINMQLATDPAVIYGIPNFSGNLTRADLERPGPYNTYLNKGLPPTPIANPGLESLKAVLNPAQTEYLYFVSQNNGSHYFSKTEAEHFNAVRRYQINP